MRLRNRDAGVAPGRGAAGHGAALCYIVELRGEESSISTAPRQVYCRSSRFLIFSAPRPSVDGAFSLGASVRERRGHGGVAVPGRRMQERGRLDVRDPDTMEVRRAGIGHTSGGTHAPRPCVFVRQSSHVWRALQCPVCCRGDSFPLRRLDRMGALSRRVTTPSRARRCRQGPAATTTVPVVGRRPAARRRVAASRHPHRSG